ncbi:hypothetical protein PsorP6_013570 [Peronosclerospora sorghi]|uniref:Uncharacterized protein n=1 Tax=Peronosclerospora sorghi TaxID=230839 RepID=A0ACC0VHU9_9STRA|nr:hypothetical protein PsorP6_013570 [Peronosclerospora sorghi]
MTEKLEGMLAELKQVAPRLRDYEPTGETWRQAEKLALDVRDQVESLLRSPQGVLQLRGCGALQDMKRLVPEVRLILVTKSTQSETH